MMTAIPAIDQAYLLSFLVELLNIPSPTGLADPAIQRVEAELASLGITTRRTAKGGLLATLDGLAGDAARGLTAHVDTLGAMVKELKPNGRLRLTQLGGFSWNAVEGEGCSVFTAGGPVVRGTILIRKASSHVYGSEVSDLKRDDENMEVRLDARTSSENETRDLGIQVGDFVAFDPRVEVGDSGFVRSRHLDDKAGVACLLSALHALLAANLRPAQRTTIHISNYEEVGHGAAALPGGLTELVAIDMAAVGEGQASDEFHTTICLKDSGGPYHAGLSARLRALAERDGIPYRVDIYPHYGSDAEAFWRSGADAQVALFGPGVDASHNYERTHIEALEATARLALSYLIS
jgi:putative aminopeptidase FrvX